MYLRDISIHADQNIVERYRGGFVGRFASECVCVEERFISLISRRIQTDGVTKISLEFTDEIHETPERSAVKQLISVLTLQWPFDFAAYVASEPSGKQKQILDAMTAALRWLASIYDWDTGPIERAYNESLELGLKMEAYLKESWVSPCKQYRVRVYYTCDIDEMTLEAVLYKNRSRKELARVLLGSDIPSPAAGLIVRGKWTSDKVFLLTTSSFRLRTIQADFSPHMELT